MHFSLRSIGISFVAALCLQASPGDAFAAFADVDPAFHAPTIADWSCEREIASLPDDSVFVVLRRFPGDAHAVAKIRSDGQPDAGWGQDGVALLPTGFYPVPPQLVPLPDGGLLAVIDRIVRFNARGAIDTAFGDNGLSDPVAIDQQVHSVALQPDGAIVALTRKAVIDVRGRVESVAFMRLTPQGRQDMSFGSGGYIVIEPTAFDRFTILAWSVGADGTAEITSSRRVLNRELIPELHRFPSDFSTAPGRLLPAHGVANWISPIANVDTSGNLLFAAQHSREDSMIQVLMFDNNGRPSESFGNRGQTNIPVSGVRDEGAAFTHPKAMWRTADGGWLILVSRLQLGHGGFFPIAVEDTTRAVRLLANGAADFLAQSPLVGGDGSTKFARLQSGKLVHSESTQTGCTLVRQLTEEPRIEATMIEYHDATLDRYFMTLEGPESVHLDQNVAQIGLVRTGSSFGAWAPAKLPGTKRLCRFVGDDGVAGTSSHFYTPEGPECDGLRALDAATPAGRPAWRFEGLAASVVDAVNEACPANLTPVYRVYNKGFSRGITSNHRYTTDVRVYEEMLRKDWAPEGVRFCVPPASSPVTIS